MDMNVVSPEQVGFSSTRLERIKPFMQSYVDRSQPPGVITAVARRGKVGHFECFGMMDVEAGKPMRPDTVMRIYSMTKPVTSVALMMLFEEGRFLLGEPVSKYIPVFKDLKVYAGTGDEGIQLADLERPITIQDLLTHTAGLGYGLFQDSPVEELYRQAGILDSLAVLQVSLPEMVRRLAELPLAHQPGTTFRYSLAHDVIGHLISVLSDLPFDVFLRERVCQPLGMDDTGFYVPQDKLDRFAALYYFVDPDHPEPMDAPATSPFASGEAHPSGGGGLVSTAADYLRFAQMLLNGGTLDGTRLLGRRTVERMTKNHLPERLLPFQMGESWHGVGYGLGFGVIMDETQRAVLVSRGTYFWPGACGVRFWVDPQEEMIVLYMAQAFGMAVPVDALFHNLVNAAVVD